ncbi:MAG TPA: T9SS type A sorting domain-containing protein [Bacteroidetes bacterium]|nr:T9SS type A sorting domain-containing protein [Bacteroidota bacterium]
MLFRKLFTMKKRLFSSVCCMLLISCVYAGQNAGWEEWIIPGTWGMSHYQEPQMPDKPDKKFRVYPNPVQDEMKIVYDLKEETPVMMEVRDITGKKVMDENLERLKGESELTVNLSGLRKGIYFIKFYSTEPLLYEIVKIQKL